MKEFTNVVKIDDVFRCKNNFLKIAKVRYGASLNGISAKIKLIMNLRIPSQTGTKIYRIPGTRVIVRRIKRDSRSSELKLAAKFGQDCRITVRYSQIRNMRKAKRGLY